MKIVDLKQGSQEWIEWRKGLVCASDSPVLVLENSSNLKVLREKLSLDSGGGNFYTELGHEHEAMIRKFLEEKNIDAEAICVQSTEYSFLGASLDGFDLFNNVVYEMKSVKEPLTEIKKDHKFYIQVQHQLLVTRAKRAELIIFCWTRNTFNIFHIEPDAEMHNKIIAAAKGFLANSPALMGIESALGAIEPLLDQFYKLKEEADQIMKRAEAIKKKAEEICANSDIEYDVINNKYSAKKVIRKGSVNYKEFCVDHIKDFKEDQLDDYRKEDTVYWDFRKIKAA